MRKYYHHLSLEDRERITEMLGEGVMIQAVLDKLLGRFIGYTGSNWQEMAGFSLFGSKIPIYPHHWHNII